MKSKVGMSVEGNQDFVLPTGYDKLGNPNIIDNIGATFLIVLLIFSLLILLLILLFKIALKLNWSQKVTTCAQKLRNKILYNPLIRLFLLNVLKLSVTALLVFYNLSDHK